MQKYHNKKYEIDGIVFASRKEGRRYCELKVLQSAGIIHDLQIQVKFVLIPTQYEESSEFYTKGNKKGQKKRGKLLEKECSYIADFVYYENGEKVVEDAKGMRTEVYKIKKKLILERYGIRIREV